MCKMDELMKLIYYFIGHTHWDEFQVIYDYHNGADEPLPVGVGYMAPSVTTFRNVNPAFR
jgi:sphingomyelin phosphodiesterase